MIRLVLSAIFLVNCTTYAASAQSSVNDTSEAVQRIRKEFQLINANENTFKKVEKELPDESSEGGALQKFYDQDKKLRKVVNTFYTEITRDREEYYIKNDSLFFVFTRHERYKEPIQVNMHPTIREVTENRYYFDDLRLILWLRNKEKINVKEWPKEATQVLQRYKSYGKQ